MKLALLILASCLALSGCEGRLPTPMSTADAEAEPSLTFEGFKARATNEGRKVWQAVAERARVYQGSQKAQAEVVDIVYFEGGRVASKAKADHAEVDMKTYDLKASGNVRVSASNGVQLETSQLNWDQKSGRARSSARVRVIRAGTVLTGRGFTADRALKDVRVLEDVQVEAASVKSLRGLGGDLRP